MDIEQAKQKLKKATEIYEKIRSQIEPKLDGQVIAIDDETGDYFVGRTDVEACNSGRKKYPGKIFVCKRVGAKTTFFVGGI